MPNIVLTTLNAKYIHAAFGLRYLFANLRDLRSDALILEFDISQKPNDIVEMLLARQPRIVGIGVYIWNVALCTEVAAILKQVCPSVTLVIGGPEVSFELEDQQIVEIADYVITGEADLEFAILCRHLLEGARPASKVIHGGIPDLGKLALPYEHYDERDISNRVIYVEASRGCPFSCEFCLSSLDASVRPFPLDGFLGQLQELLDRGVNRFKFVDRTFNLNIETSKKLLEFFYERYRSGMFLHFEMIPDRLPEALRKPISLFPPGALQFEIGIQTLNGEIGARIKRRQNLERTIENLRFLKEQTEVHIHADLIVGLPGETVESFARGFDRLVSLAPQEIQVGILKRLRGTPISRHDADWGMVYSGRPPYEVLKNNHIDFSTMQRLRRFARYWDLTANSGNFVGATPKIWQGNDSPFRSFLRWSEWLFAQVGRSHSIALARLSELLFDYLTQCLAQPEVAVAQALWEDYQRGGRNDKPQFLKTWLPDRPGLSITGGAADVPKRQARHLGGA